MSSSFPFHLKKPLCKVLIGLAVLLAFLVFLTFLRFLNKKRPESTHVHTPVSTEYSTDELNSIRDGFFRTLDEKDPSVALQEMRERIKTDDALSRACHDLMHDLGHEAYKKYKDVGTALKYRDELCNSGYIHGVIESYLAESKDILASMNSMCTPYKVGGYISWECYHGAGHGIMYYTNNDLPKSLEICSQYGSEFARSSCVNGVFMENMSTEQGDHHSEFLKADDLFFPCNTEPTEYRNDCYLYAPVHYLSYHKNDYLGALKWCKSAEKQYIAACIQGVGTQVMKENINNPKYVEEVCSTSRYVSSCIVGMVGLYINHYGALEPAKALCDQLAVSNQAACRLSISSNESMFQP